MTQTQTPSQVWTTPAPVSSEASSAGAAATVSTVVTVAGDAKLPAGVEQHKGDEHDKLSGGDEKRLACRVRV